MWCLVRRLSTRRAAVTRGYLSASFGCEEAWKERLQSQVLKKAQPEEMYRRLEQRSWLTPLDVDVLANATLGSSRLWDELEDAVHRLRAGPHAAGILPSTAHAFVRLAVEAGPDEDRLLAVLDDRLNYGLFLDDYCSLMLLDRYLEGGRTREAAKVAALCMLQEDFQSPLVAHMSLLASYRFASNPTPWTDDGGESEKDKEQDKDDDEEEEIKVRVKYLRNPYFDDHFDLREADHLVGKTLMMAGQTLGDPLGDSFYLVGSGLYSKWAAAEDKLKKLADGGHRVYGEAVGFFRRSLEKYSPREGEEEAWDGVKSRLEDCLRKMENAKSVIDGDMAALTESRIKNLVQKEEAGIVSRQKEIYKEWIEHRENLVMRLVEETRKEERLARVRSAKEELDQREEELFFFDRENELDLKIENKKVVYPKKWTGRKKKKRAETIDYVPPVVN